MKDRPNRPSRSVPPTRSAPTSGRPRTPQRGGGRPQQRQNPRNRQLLAVGALVLVIAVVVGVVLLTQGNQASPGNGSLTGALPDEAVGHFRGSASAQVIVTEWSDFQ